VIISKISYTILDIMERTCSEFYFFQEGAAKQLEILQKEIQDSTEELSKITPLYDKQVGLEQEKTKR